jgi:hypothetical protein
MFAANPKPSDLCYLPSRATGYGSWNPNEPLTDLRLSWLEYFDFGLDKYHQPDLEALRIQAAVLLSHYVLTEKAIWIFLIGESSTGKTSFFIEPFSSIPAAEVKSNVTPKSFLSGLGRGKSLLERTGPSGIWLFKDFTSILQMSYESRGEVMKYLREIWDGHVSNETGSDAKRLEWSGKITTVAACTYVIDSYWSALSELGERFLRINLRCPDHEGAHQAASAQVGSGNLIQGKLQSLAKRAFLNSYRFWESVAPPSRHNGLKTLTIPPDKIRPTPEIDKLLFSFSKIVATCRRSCRWDYQRKEIIHIGKTELPSRISRSLWLLMLSHAHLFGRTVPEEEDFRAAQRISLDSMPEDRRLVLMNIPLHSEITKRAMFKTLGRQMSRRQFHEALEELTAVGLIDLKTPPAASLDDDVYISFSPSYHSHFVDLLSNDRDTDRRVVPIRSKA